MSRPRRWAERYVHDHRHVSTGVHWELPHFSCCPSRHSQNDGHSVVTVLPAASVRVQ